MQDAQNIQVVERGVSAESARAVLVERGKLSTAELVRLRMRYFSDGAILGSKTFIEDIFNHQREQFSPRRRTGTRRIRESGNGLHTLRDLRLRALG